MSVKKLPEIVNALRKNSVMSPSLIAKTIKSDIRTVEKIIIVAEKMNMIKCKKLEMTGRTYTTCELNTDYKTFLNKRNNQIKKSKKSLNKRQSW
jgi:hypothetical protein